MRDEADSQLAKRQFTSGNEVDCKWGRIGFSGAVGVLISVQRGMVDYVEVKKGGGVKGLWKC